MATAMLLKRQFYPSSRVSISTLTSLLHVIPTSLPSPTTPLTTIPTALPPFYRYSSQAKTLIERASGVHARSGSGSVDFGAAFGTRAGFAVEDYSDEDKIRSDNGGGGENEGLEIEKLGIHQDVVQALHKKGITKLFPIQKAVLEPAMQGRDMIGRAKTGTGKTLAFGIPIMDKITRHNAEHGCGRNPMALILAPTRELAKQVEKEFFESSKLDTICVYGGTPITRQMSVLSRGVDVVTGTPGRVIDLMKRGALVLSDVQFVVLDEADQMLNVGFADDVEVILEKLPQNRQTMMFSATMPNWILKLTRKFLNDPLTIDLVGDSDQKLAEGISLYSVVADHRSKAGVIGPLVTEHANGGKCIVFTQTKRDADNLAHALGRNNYRCEPLHGDIAQGQRERTLQRFRDGDINILVATDVAARGLDIPNVDLVIHYEMPSTSEIFVHRSGRTGRAGKKGTAILISTMDQSRAVRVIERDIGCKLKELPPVAVDGVVMETSRGMGSRFGSGGGFDNSGFSRSGGFGNSGFGRQGGYNDSGRSKGYGGQSSGRSFGFGDSGSGGFGSYGDSSYRSSSGRSSSFGNYGGSGLGRSDGGFGNEGRGAGSRGSDILGSSRQSRFGDTGPTQSSGGFGGSSSRRFGGFGDTRS